MFIFRGSPHCPCREGAPTFVTCLAFRGRHPAGVSIAGDAGHRGARRWNGAGSCRTGVSLPAPSTPDDGSEGSRVGVRLLASSRVGQARSRKDRRPMPLRTPGTSRSVPVPPQSRPHGCCGGTVEVDADEAFHGCPSPWRWFGKGVVMKVVPTTPCRARWWARRAATARRSLDARRRARAHLGGV
jgi:hypothetical protein